VRTGNLAKRIFQELYLGEDLFREIYAELPLFYHDQGYINREILIPGMSHLKKLASCNRLSIATGRPGVEAHYALTHFGLSDIFSAVVTEDDIVRGEKQGDKPLRKPHPYSLELCMEECGYKRGDSVYYIGDMPDDMKASLRAGITPIGFVNNSGIKPELMSTDEHYKLLTENGATRVFFHFDDLVAFCTRSGD
jgi:phosphoglycolate phosphatase-like HAD superfamily hydrolase